MDYDTKNPPAEYSFKELKSISTDIDNYYFKNIVIKKLCNKSQKKNSCKII